MTQLAVYRRTRARLARPLLTGAVAESALAGSNAPAAATTTPNVAIHTLQKPAVVQVGQSFTVTVTVRKLGTTPASPTVSVWLDANREIGAGDTVLFSSTPTTPQVARERQRPGDDFVTGPPLSHRPR
jgi:hypothetical protein